MTGPTVHRPRPSQGRLPTGAPVPDPSIIPCRRDLPYGPSHRGESRPGWPAQPPLVRLARRRPPASGVRCVFVLATGSAACTVAVAALRALALVALHARPCARHAASDPAPRRNPPMPAPRASASSPPSPSPSPSSRHRPRLRGAAPRRHRRGEPRLLQRPRHPESSRAPPPMSSPAPTSRRWSASRSAGLLAGPAADRSPATSPSSSCPSTTARHRGRRRPRAARPQARALPARTSPSAATPGRCSPTSRGSPASPPTRRASSPTSSRSSPTCAPPSPRSRLGEADATFVYRTDAATSRGVRVIEIPPAPTSSPTTPSPSSPPRRSARSPRRSSPSSAASEGQRILADAGFRRPHPVSAGVPRTLALLVTRPPAPSPCSSRCPSPSSSGAPPRTAHSAPSSTSPSVRQALVLSLATSTLTLVLALAPRHTARLPRSPAPTSPAAASSTPSSTCRWCSRRPSRASPSSSPSAAEGPFGPLLEASRPRARLHHRRRRALAALRLRALPRAQPQGGLRVGRPHLRGGLGHPRRLAASPASGASRSPSRRPALISGSVLCWARALSELGATLIFAGNFPGRTQTMPLAIITAFESSQGLAAAVAISVVLLAVSCACCSRCGSRPRRMARGRRVGRSQVAGSDAAPRGHRARRRLPPAPRRIHPRGALRRRR